MIRSVRPLVRFSTSIPIAVRAILGILLTLSLAWCYRRYSLTFISNSDFANSLLEGDAIFHGNVLLKHWVLTTVSYYTTDALPYAIGVAVRGCDPVLLHEIPVAVYVSTLIAAMFLATNPRTTGRGRNVWGAVIVFALIGLPAEPSAFHFLLGPARGSTIFYMLLMYLALDTPDQRPVSTLRLFLFGAVLTVALIGDDFPKYIIVAPILLVSLLRVWRNRNDWRAEARIAGTAVAALIAAKLVAFALTSAGGFTVPPADPEQLRIIPLNHLARNIGFTVEAFQNLYLSDFWGEPVRAGLLLRVLRLLSPALLMFGVYYVARHLKKSIDKSQIGTVSVDRVSAYIAVGMIVNVFAYCITSLAVGLETTRYLVPFCVFGAVLLGREVSGNIIAERKIRRRIVFAALACAILSIPSFALSVMHPFPDPPARRIGEWLKAQNLRDGYGAYWSSAEVTARSSNQVRVRPIVRLNDTLQPFFWGVDAKWYAPGTTAYFVIVDNNGFGGVTTKFTASVFGKPSRVVTRDGYTLLIYDRDISGRLANKPVIKE